MKPPVRKIIAWHPVLTDHQAYTYEALTYQSGLPVVVHVARLEDQTRRAQGWTDTRVTSVERRLMPARGSLRHGLRCLIQHRDQIHLFGSVFEKPQMLLLLWLGTRMGMQCYLVSEPYANVAFGYFDNRNAWRERLKVRLRPHVYRFAVLTLRRRLQGVFAISRLALQQFAAAGMPPQRLFPFGYFVPSSVGASPAGRVPDDRSPSAKGLKLAFVGSLIAIKGLETLVAAVRRAIARGAALELDVYGPGDPAPFGFDGIQIRYGGRIPFGSAQERLRGHDLLVLPSHYDGWGVVVNEALCAGVPVLCSDAVGARVLVDTFGAGRVFPRGDEAVLADLLVALAVDPGRVQSMKSACASAAEAIQPARAAAYMLQVMTAEPNARAAIPSPWYRTADR